MKVVIDNNIIIDALNPNPEFEADAKEILRLAAERSIEGFISANSITDIFYVLRKKHGIDKSKEIIKKLLLMLDIIGIEPDDCTAALDAAISDLEDALVEVCAKKIHADFIVTRDEKFIGTSGEVSIIRPKDFLPLCYKQ